MTYSPKHPIRIVTAASLFDGHDATINIIRRLLQDFGAEVIHLGHNRSVRDIVVTALQEGVQGICVSSYQGGHMSYFKYMKDLLDQRGASFIKIYGGGGGVIIHEEKRELEAYGIAQIFHPDDGRRLGLEGMILEIIKGCDFNPLDCYSKQSQYPKKDSDLHPKDSDLHLGMMLNQIENGLPSNGEKSLTTPTQNKVPKILGITGTGGAGKSSLIDEIAQRFLNAFPDKRIAVVCVDPSKKKTGGALLGDRIRMNSLSRDGIFMRSLASRGSGKEIANSLSAILAYLKQQPFDLIIAETSGIGQGNMAITEISDISLYVMTSDYGASSQLEKIDMIDFAQVIAVNKADHRGSLDALREVTKQFRRSRKIFDSSIPVPVYLTQASQFNDSGINQLFLHLIQLLEFSPLPSINTSQEHSIIPPERQNYLSEITSAVRKYKKRVRALKENASNWGSLVQVQKLLPGSQSTENINLVLNNLTKDFSEEEKESIKNFEKLQEKYASEEYVFKVREKEIRQPLKKISLSGNRIPRVVVPKFTDWGERFQFLKLENVPGAFPYTAGVFPLKRTDEDPKRMFAGEGTPEQTNRRFHYLCKGESAQRLSTAFDSVTLYGQDPQNRPDIFGKVGESGVSICSLDDMKKLYSGFDLCSPSTSVSMTINGPAPMVLAFFFNTAIDQQVLIEESKKGRPLTPEERKIVADCTLMNVRGTVQADILKEDQGQNTCIFSIPFALKMMGDIQEYFVKKSIKNFYSVSISGYHIAEAGANPISQLAFTLANGFTYVEYYLNRGLKIDDFAQSLSFFFSNGLDPEYLVLGRVARRIWAIALRDLYQGNDRSQKLKYHIQTSGRSLHAQEIAFNDIRTTLQALIALFDHCNSLHTNAYDEAITTPTEESVRRAMAIQLIINKELGWSINENPLQGSYFIEELTDLVEEAVLNEFLRLNERGGVLGAMETQYQRSKIQEESLFYEKLKHDGTLPIIGVNSFIDPKTLAPDYQPPKIDLARASLEQKQFQLDQINEYKKKNKEHSDIALEQLKNTALKGENIFEALMEAARVCSLQQMTQALYQVGGEYRRNV